MDTDLKNISVKLASVTVFRNITESEVLRSLIDFLVCDEGSVKKTKLYSAFVASLYAHDCDLGKYIRKHLYEDENDYVIRAAQKQVIPECMKQAAQAELKIFSELSALNPSSLAKLTGFDGYLPTFDNTAFDFEKEYSEKLDRLFKDGYGIYSKYFMFNIKNNGEITPLKSADKITTDDLVGYEGEREKVIANTRALVDSKPAANILLCGDAGTGKSSTVKAVANMFAKDGVRLIEIQKEQLMCLPLIMEEINHNPLKFIIFIDDLSFNKTEDGFGTLKAILEGSASAKANNAVIYATSNRRHLVKESFSDRDGDDIHRADTIQELLSLSERFGLTIQYSKPNKELYLRIVKSLAEKKKIDIDENELYMKAEVFALRKGGRSARAAKQFVDGLVSIG
ncbi:MAG: ATP-binding protein [Faecalibacterium sp.]|nr:ATP-binding protein [Ruminococcus sp.]MCM1392706.1 ATP-binding protein [Ruminococcus sp.]MCM1485300.1 ATP-binding protein [Faecalibacterium sp.]